MSNSSIFLKVSAVVLLCATVTPAGFAQTPQSSTNGTSSMAPEQTGAVKIPIADNQREPLARVMHSKHNSCFVEDLDPGDDSSMIMVCGVAQLKTQFSP